MKDIVSLYLLVVNLSSKISLPKIGVRLLIVLLFTNMYRDSNALPQNFENDASINYRCLCSISLILFMILTI